VTGRQRRDDQPHARAAVHLAGTLRIRREERGLSRATLAEMAGVSAATLAKLEQHQTTDPSFFTIAALADALDYDLQQLADTARSALPVTAVSIGYEGRDQESLIDELVHRGVEVLADVRLNAVSRRPGFSKNRLRTALQEAGIEYRHYRALGNPQDNRAPFRTGHAAAGRAVFERLLRQPAAAAELTELTQTARYKTTAVFCVELNPQQCHRQVIVLHIAIARHPKNDPPSA
jgi:transcriptional regulator with XRE-family HTH domain